MGVVGSVAGDEEGDEDGGAKGDALAGRDEEEEKRAELGFRVSTWTT